MILQQLAGSQRKKKQVLWHYRFEVGQRTVTQNQ